jgi:hypothetical protein
VRVQFVANSRNIEAAIVPDVFSAGVLQQDIARSFSQLALISASMQGIKGGSKPARTPMQ